MSMPHSDTAALQPAVASQTPLRFSQRSLTQMATLLIPRESLRKRKRRSPCSPPCQEPHDESWGVSQMPEVFPPL